MVLQQDRVHYIDALASSVDDTSTTSADITQGSRECCATFCLAICLCAKLFDIHFRTVVGCIVITVAAVAAGVVATVAVPSSPSRR